MTTDQIKEKIREIIKDTYDLNDVTDEGTLRDGLGLDSLDIVEVTLLLERDLDIRIPDEVGELFGEKTIPQIAVAISKVISKK
jgi:acyl carrier protein